MAFGGVALAFTLAAAPALAPIKAAASPAPNASKSVLRPDGNDTTGAGDANRVSPSYDPKGIDLGAFLFFPQMESGEQYNSNVFAAQNNPKGDWITVLSPQARLQSRFSAHALNLIGGVDHYRYNTYQDDNHTDGRLSADGRLDVTKTTEVTALISGARGHEDRGSPDAQTAARRPTPTQTLNSLLGIKQAFNKLILSGSVAADRLTFENVSARDGSTIRNTPRNRTELTVVERAGYEFTPGYSAVAQVSENRRDYDSLDAANLDRSSTGYRVDTGLGFDISQLLKGDALVGYFIQDYDAAALKTAAGLAVKVALNWTPTELTLVVPSLERIVQETTSTGASGMVHSAGSVLVRHELQRNVIVTGYLGVSFDQYSGTRQDSWTSEARTSMTYAFTPEVYLKGELGQKIKRASVDNTGYAQTTGALRLGLRL
ncbi:conserved exported hypothetical protein [Candidatus Terasakiella magnetica]|nr:conserved exported hypothetical protein [Candidatus Terasakiella magnetica]